MEDRPKIMVVDDSEMSRNTLRGFFSEAGCEVVCEESGEGAWMALNAGTAVDLLILDWHMPMGMSGPQLNKKIQADDRFKMIPVVAFTSKWSPDMSTPESMDWVASFSGMNGANMRVRDHSEVAKSMGKSDASRIPPELVITVVERLKEAGKSVPGLLREAAASLKSQGFAA